MTPPLTMAEIVDRASEVAWQCAVGVAGIRWLYVGDVRREDMRVVIRAALLESLTLLMEPTEEMVSSGRLGVHDGHADNLAHPGQRYSDNLDNIAKHTWPAMLSTRLSELQALDKGDGE